jgi:hypothetical protein
MSIAIIVGIVLVVLSIFLFLWMAITEPMQKFSVWTEWFNKYQVNGMGGNPPGCRCCTSGKQGTVTCVQQTQLANYLYGNNLEYMIGNLFNSAQYTLSYKWQVDLITSLMRTFAYGVVSTGFLLPAHICCGIAPRAMYEKYVPDASTGATFWNTCVNPVSNNTIRNTWAKITGVKTYLGSTYWIDKTFPPCYPGGKMTDPSSKDAEEWGNTAPNWRTFMASVWGLEGTGDYTFDKFANSQEWFDGWKPVIDGKGDCNKSAWNHPSNFLWNCYQMPHNSPMIMAYMTNIVNFAGSPSPSQGFNALILGTLLGASGAGGHALNKDNGWIGLLKMYDSPDSKIATLYQDIWMQVGQVYIYLSDAGSNKPKSCSGTAKAGVSGALGGAGAGAMIGAAFPPFGALIGGVIGALAGGFGSAGAQAASQGSNLWGSDCGKKDSSSLMALAGDGELLETILATGKSSNCSNCTCCDTSEYSHNFRAGYDTTRIHSRSELIGV